MEKDKIDNKIKENRGKIVFIVIAIVLSVAALFLTKNFLYFIIAGLLFLSIYVIMYSKNLKTKRRVANISWISSSAISALCLFSYMYSRWILPFTLDLMRLPALNVIDPNESLAKVADVFGIIGLVFLGIAIGFLIVWYLVKKKEELTIEEEIEKNLDKK